MKVLLTEEIENLGIVCDVVEVKPGYARNFLFPRGLAVEVTPHNMRLMERKKAKYLKEMESLRQSAEGQREKLEALVLDFERKAGENGVLFGSVTTSDIEKRLEEMGVEADRKRFHLPEPIKKVGHFSCMFRLHPEVVAELKVEVKPEGELEAVAVEEVVAEAEPPVAEAVEVKEESDSITEDSSEESAEEEPKTEEE